MFLKNHYGLEYDHCWEIQKSCTTQNGDIYPKLEYKQFLVDLSQFDHKGLLVTNMSCNQKVGEINPVLEYDHESNCIESWF